MKKSKAASLTMELLREAIEDIKRNSIERPDHVVVPLETKRNWDDCVTDRQGTRVYFYHKT